VVAEIEPTPTPQPVVPIAVPVPPEAAAPEEFPIVPILMVGIALLLVVLMLFVTLLRRSRRATGASLITHSMDNHKSK
jgi:hypothetical protein